MVTSSSPSIALCRGSRGPSRRIRLPVMVLYRPSTTTPPRGADCVSTYAREPVLLRITRNTPVGTWTTFRARRGGGPGGAPVGRTHASCGPEGPLPPASKPSTEPSAVSEMLPADRPLEIAQVVTCRVARWITPAIWWPGAHRPDAV